MGKQRHLGVENLEDRRLLAGDVADIVVGAGNLPRRDSTIEPDYIYNELEREEDRGDDRIPNNNQSEAELLPLGFDMGEFEAIDVRGELIEETVGSGRSSEVAVPNANPPVVLFDDGSFLTANPVSHTSGIPIAFDGVLGDSVDGYNSNNSAGLGGDADFYELLELEPGQWITAHVDGAPASVLALYDEFGTVIESTEASTEVENYIFHEVEEAGDYYIAIVPYDPAVGVGNFRLPLNPVSGPDTVQGGPAGNYTLTIGVDAVDADFYAVDLMPGDILGVNGIGAADVISLRKANGDLMLQSSTDRSDLYPVASPLPGGGNTSLAYVIDTPGRYIMTVNGHQYGNYLLETRVFRPAIESAPEGTNQILFLDFDGALFNSEVVFGAPKLTQLSPMSSYLRRWGLDNEDALINAIIREVEDDYIHDLQAVNPNSRFTILNSRDHADPFGQPYVSRIIVGGSQGQLGIQGIFGIAESIDLGNFDMSETAVVLLDTFAAPSSDPNSANHYPIAPGARRVDLVARALSVTISHEAGHIFGAWHTEAMSADTNIIDGGGTRPESEVIGVGPDLIWGTADDFDVDFVEDIFDLSEGYTGVSNVPGMFANIFISGKGEDFVPTQSVSGTIFNDVDGDGERDAGEGGVEGARVYVDVNRDGEFGIGEPSSLSDATGSFTVPGVTADDTPLKLVVLPGSVVTTPEGNAIPLTSSEFVFGVRSESGTSTGTDYGDAPASYGVASHLVQSTIHLGASVDGDVLGQVDDGPDDDGVSLSGLVIGGTGTGIITATSGDLPAAVVNGWIDFNGDGAFSGSEQIIRDVEVEGTRQLEFSVPASAVAGTTWARFRYGFDRGIGAVGEGRVGEVEDYEVTIVTSGDGGGPVEIPPTAADDFVVVLEDSVDVNLNVLTNDSAGSAAISISSVGVPSQGGSVSISGDGLRLVYSPAADFVGQETFSYSIASSVGSDTGIVTVDVQSDGSGGNGDPIVGFRLEAADAEGNELTDVNVGDEFVLNVYTDDLRVDGEGVYSGYLDVVFDGDLASPNGVVTFGDDYTAGFSPTFYRVTDAGSTTLTEGELLTPEEYSAARDEFGADAFTAETAVGETGDIDGEFDDYGAFAGITDSFGPDAAEERLLFSVPMVADESGTLVFTSNPADILPRHETLVFDIASQAVPEERIVYGSTTLTINGGVANASFTNPSNRFDVNNNGSVEPRDALILINSINQDGARALNASAAPIATGFYLDVNQDNNLSAIDVLNVINYLNGLVPAAEPVAAAVVASSVDTSAVDAVFDLGDEDDDEVSVFDII